MTLTPANLKKFCTVSKHSHLAARPFCQRSDELPGTAELPPCTQLFTDAILRGYEIMRVYTCQLMPATF